MVEAIDRLDLDAVHRAVLQHLKRDVDPGISLRPDLAVEIGQILRRLALDADDHVAALDARLVRRPAWRDAAHEQAPAQLFGVEAEPRPSRTGYAPAGDEVGEDRRQPVDRDEHVAGRLLPSPDGVADNQRSDANELARAIDERRPAPGRMRR